MNRALPFLHEITLTVPFNSKLSLVQCLGNMEDDDWINVNYDDVPSEECRMNKDKLEEKNEEGSDDEVDDDLLVATIQIQPGSTPSAAR